MLIDMESIPNLIRTLSYTLENKGGWAGLGLSLLHAGPRLSFLISGVVVRRTGAFTLVVVVSTACASACYARACSRP